VCPWAAEIEVALGPPLRTSALASALALSDSTLTVATMTRRGTKPITAHYPNRGRIPHKSNYSRIHSPGAAAPAVNSPGKRTGPGVLTLAGRFLCRAGRNRHSPAVAAAGGEQGTGMPMLVVIDGSGGRRPEIGVGSSSGRYRPRLLEYLAQVFGGHDHLTSRARFVQRDRNAACKQTRPGFGGLGGGQDDHRHVCARVGGSARRH
jgi:hypothetical protein